jgi:tetratricopeptide (TPR) repeat protein
MIFLLAFLLPLFSSRNNGSDSYPGDREFTLRDYPSAVAAYEARLQVGADSAEALWRLARVQICLGDIAEDAECEAYYRKGEQFARTAVRCDSLNSDAHTWLAVAVGSIAMFEGSGSKVRMANEIKYHLDRAISLNPSDDVAYSVLGSFYASLGNISWIERQLAGVFLGRLPEGGYEEAEAAFHRAIALAPSVVRHHYALGLLYKTLDRNPEACAELEKAASLPAVLARDVNDQRRARDLVLSLK